MAADSVFGAVFLALVVLPATGAFLAGEAFPAVVFFAGDFLAAAFLAGD